MSAMSDWLEGVLASHLLGSGTFSKPSTLAVALCSGTPVDSMTGATIPELPNAGAYARQTLNPSATNWTDPVAADGIAYNLATITFPVATSDWGWVSGIAILDSATYGAGHVLLRGSLTTPKNIGSSDEFLVRPSGFSITFS